MTSMKITALVENVSNGDLKPKHGLSLYIETAKHKILFDVGPDNTLFQNSQKCGIDLSKIDTVILSHGHKDHGGALARFLTVNRTAKVYAQQGAFAKHYAKFLFIKADVGVPGRLRTHPRIVMVDGDLRLDDELCLFTVPQTQKYPSSANDGLYTQDGKDDFSHEQNLMILGDVKVLVMGCGHAGIVNILERAASFGPEICVGGYHLFNPLTRQTAPEALLDKIAQELKQYGLHYYTCHCTGEKAYQYLKNHLPDMHYLHCGETIDFA